FFFQAEDGIRDFHVTGVQTCALPIYRQLDRLRLVGSREVWFLVSGADKSQAVELAMMRPGPRRRDRTLWLLDRDAAAELPADLRSEERRVGKARRYRRRQTARREHAG